MTLQSLLVDFDFDSGDNTLPIASNDPVLASKASSDCTFDARAAAGYAGGALPVVGAQIPSLGLAGLLPTAMPLLSRANRSYSAVPIADASRADYIGGAWSFDGRTGLYVLASDIATHEVWNPVAEGFRNHLFVVWFKSKVTPPAAITGLAGSGIGAFNTSGFHFGFVQQTDGSIREAAHGVLVSAGAVLDGDVHQVAVHYAYDTGADTTTSRAFFDGQEIGAPVVQGAHKPSQHSVNTSPPGGGGSRASIGQAAGYGSWGNGSIYRVDRVFTRVPVPGAAGSFAALDPAVRVADDWALNQALRTL
ncbi:hypothetical protein ACPVPU_07360 [Sphingomonas sp. CJ99]